MRFLIRTILLASACMTAASAASAQRASARLFATAAPATIASGAARPDSLIWERFPKDPPPGVRRVPERKFQEFGPGALLDSAVTLLRTAGFFDLSSAQVADACGNPGTTVSRFQIRVRDNGAWRELIIPDECKPASATLAAQLDGMTHTLLLLRGHAIKVR